MISNCDDVRGLLPWFLNSTLDDDERQQVMQHLATCPTCRKDLADTRLAAEIFDQHPPAEAILALAWDETPRGIDRELLEEHLAECPRCAGELELARMSRRLEEDDRIVPLTPRTAPAPVQAPARPWSGWKAAALAAGLAGVVAFSGWFQTAERIHTLEEQLAERPAVPSPAPAPSAAGGSGADAAQAQRLTELAAQLKAAQEQTAALRTQEQELRGRIDQLAAAGSAAPAPQINAWIKDLQPSADVVRGGGTAEPLEIPGRSSGVLLLGASHKETHRDHTIEIVDPSGKVVWSAAGLARNPQADLYPLTLPPGALPAGVYTLRVYGVTDGRREPVESYSIRVK